MYKISILEGDGIGPEIVDSTVKVLKAIEKSVGEQIFEFIYLPVGLEAYKRFGSTFPERTKNMLYTCDGAILGPVTTHLYDPEQNMVNPSAAVRTIYDLYANIRPVRSTPRSNFPGVDLVTIREATEGMYADRNLYKGTGEIMPDKDTVLSIGRVTRNSTRRIAKVAFEVANERNKYVSIIHKANVLREGCGLFLEESRNISKSYQEVKVDDYHIDAFAMYLVQHPEKFDVIVTTNMFGDILSDEAAGLVGGLGFAPGLNMGDNFAVAQAAHGSAPSIAGKNLANPIAEILSAQLMIQWLAKNCDDQQLYNFSNILKKAVWSTIDQNIVWPFDVGGHSSNKEICEAIIKKIDSVHI